MPENEQYILIEMCDTRYLVHVMRSLWAHERLKREQYNSCVTGGQAQDHKEEARLPLDSEPLRGPLPKKNNPNRAGNEHNV